MMIDFGRMITVMVELGINEKEFVLLGILYHKDYANLYKYLQEMPEGFKPELIDKLVEQGYINDYNKSGNYMADNLEVTRKFAHKLFTSDENEVCEEFWNEYPAFISIDGKQIAARNTDKELFFNNYYEKVGHSLDYHKRVMENLRFAKQHGMIRMGIKRWFDSNQWEAIEQVKKQEVAGKDLPSRKTY